VPTETLSPTHRKQRGVVKGSALYTAFTVAQRGIVFALLPVFAHALSPAGFGRLGVLIVLLQSAVLVFSFGQEFAMFRQWFQLGDDQDERRAYLRSLGTFLIAAPLCMACLLEIVVGATGADIASLPPRAVELAILAAALQATATIMPLSLLQAQERFQRYAIVSGTSTVLTSAFTVLAVVTLHWGVSGYAGGVAAAAIVTWLVAAIALPWPRVGVVRRAHVRQAMALGLPMLPHLVSSWAINLADRAVLVGLISLAALGRYTAASNLAWPVIVVSLALNQGTRPSYGRAGASTSEHGSLAALITMQFLFSATAGCAAALLGPPALVQLFPPSYQSAAPLIPWLAFGNALYAFYAVPMNAITIFGGKNKYVWVVTASAAAIQIGLLYVVVPSYGVLGAAIVSAGGSALFFAGIMIFERCVIPGFHVHYDWLTICAGFVTIGGLYVVVDSCVGYRGIADLLARLAAMVVIAVLVGGLAARSRLQGALARRRHRAPIAGSDEERIPPHDG